MQENVQGSPVIVEAQIPEYRWGSRYAIYTGLPTVLGWNWHQRQQRAAVEALDVPTRAEDISSFYLTTSPSEAIDFLSRYDVRYVVVGELEQLYYGNFDKCQPIDGGGRVTCDMAGRLVGQRTLEVPASQCETLGSALACPTGGLEKFDAMESLGILRAVYRNGSTIIYEVLDLIVAWWLIASLLGLLAFPLTYRIFHRLPDRGWAFARPLGLLAASYVLWLGASVDLIPNNLGGAVGGVLALGGLSYWAARGKRTEITTWIKDNRRTLISMEVLFGVSYLVWAFVRANNSRNPVYGKTHGAGIPQWNSSLRNLPSIGPLAVWLRYLVLLLWICDHRTDHSADRLFRSGLL